MRKTFFLLLLATPAGAAIGGAAVTEFTATQAILKYQAPDSSPCSVEVSENPNFQPLVHDVNPAKFTGAGNDNRAGNVLAGAERWFVIGKRAADVGLEVSVAVTDGAGGLEQPMSRAVVRAISDRDWIRFMLIPHRLE